MRNLIRIATRQSQLALWQANHVKTLLMANFPDLAIELVGITTEGDKHLDVILAKLGGKGVFVKELEIAIAEQRADIAVHSLKDLPVELPPGFTLAAVLARGNPYDAFVANDYHALAELPSGAIIGTSSLRRSCQLVALRPDVQIKILRGNVNTRLRKLDAGEYAAIILAVAGLERLNLSARIREIIPPEVSLPAPGRGAMGIECLANDPGLIAMLQSLDHLPTRQCVAAERALNRYLEGGCHVPIGAFAEFHGEELHLRGLVGKPDGSLMLHTAVSGNPETAETLGHLAAANLLQQGAAKILGAVYQNYGKE